MKRKVIIKSVPQAQSGLEVKMNNLRAGLGFNANKMPWPVMAGKMSAPDVEVNSTLQPVPRDQANLEAEKGEVAALPTKSGVPDTFKISGERHHSGGTPLNLPSDSFIFSDTAKMKIKDPTVLAQFGLSEKSGGYTPAEIAKKYDVNSFKKILMDPDTDKLQKQTAELMISNYNLKLAKLAIVQESMKGFPQGIPAIAMPYIEEMGIDPAQFVQMNPGGAQDEQAQTQQGEMDDVGAEAQGRFGGFMQDGGNLDDLYNMKRALELGYKADETEHWPSVDSETGMWLKSKDHPTAWKEFMYGQLNADLAKNYDVRANPEGFFGEKQLQYVPKKQMGGDIDYFQVGGGKPRYVSDPALDDITAYLRERNAAKEKKAQYDAIYRKALADQEAKWLAQQEAKDAIQNAKAAEAHKEYIIKNELKRREDKIKRLKQELQTGKESHGLLSFPASGNTQAKLEKEMKDYQNYLNKVNTTNLPAATAPELQPKPLKFNADYKMSEEEKAYHQNKFGKTPAATTVSKPAETRTVTVRAPKQDKQVSNIKPNAKGMYEVNDITPEEAAALGITL